jgi:hypothetical protein
MTWEAHADHLVKTISKKLFVLRQLRSEVNDKTLVTAYHTLVRSNITYAILVWGHSTHLRKVFNQRRRCIRVLGGLGYRDDCKDIFKTFKILTVPCIYILQCVLYMYKNKDNYCTLNHSHLTRHHKLLLSIHSRLHKTQNSTRYYLDGTLLYFLPAARHRFGKTFDLYLAYSVLSMHTCVCLVP